MRSPNCRPLAALLTVIVLNAGSASADLISTYPPLGSPAGTFGVGPIASETWGQVVTAPTDGQTLLTGFTFVSVNVPPSLPLRGHVYDWDAAHERATGSALFVSPITHTTGGFDNVLSFDTGGINLVSGNPYVLFLSTSEFFGSQPAVSASLRLGGLPYSGGGLAILNNDGDTSKWTNASWIVEKSLDMAFTANFTAPTVVSEPSSLVLLTLAFLSLAARMVFSAPNRYHGANPIL